MCFLIRNIRFSNCSRNLAELQKEHEQKIKQNINLTAKSTIGLVTSVSFLFQRAWLLVLDLVLLENQPLPVLNVPGKFTVSF